MVLGMLEKGLDLEKKAKLRGLLLGSHSDLDFPTPQEDIGGNYGFDTRTLTLGEYGRFFQYLEENEGFGYNRTYNF
jgi:hypothetical protein